MSTSNVPISTDAVVGAERVIMTTGESERVSWGAILGGLTVALGAWILLSVLGLAVGLSSVDPNHPATLKSATMATGIWSLVTPVLALLAGGLVAARTAGIVRRPTAAIHGLVLWSLSTVASIALVGSLVRGVVSAATGLGSTGAGAADSEWSEANPARPPSDWTDEARQDFDLGALRAADATGKALWFVFVGMACGLVAAVAGSTLGVSRRQRLAARPERVLLATSQPAHS